MDGTTLVITGADTHDWASLAAVGASSTGVPVQVTLNNWWFDLTFPQAFTLVHFDMWAGNDTVQMGCGLTLPADVRAGEGSNFVQTARGTTPSPPAGTTTTSGPGPATTR